MQYVRFNLSVSFVHNFSTKFIKIYQTKKVEKIEKFEEKINCWINTIALQ